MLDLVLPERGNTINDDPRKTPSKVDRLMHDKTHDARRQHIVLHIDVPCCPQLLKVIERDIVFGDFVELRPVCVLWEPEGVVSLRGC